MIGDICVSCSGSGEYDVLITYDPGSSKIERRLCQGCYGTGMEKPNPEKRVPFSKLIESAVSAVRKKRGV